MSPGPTLAVMAKAPVPGRAKTRLTPPCTPAQAARLAEAALVDTLRTAVASRADRRVLVLDGPPGPWLPGGVEIVSQGVGGLGDRLAAAVARLGGPILLLGADTPHLPSTTVDDALARLVGPEVDAVIGPAVDGGYWTIGLRAPDAAVFAGVPMSTPQTFAAQRRRLRELGLRVAELPAQRDVDTIEDARAAAKACPDNAFAATLRELGLATGPVASEGRGGPYEQH